MDSADLQPPVFHRLMVREGVANFLRDTILAGKLNPGDRIVEIKWAKQLKVAQSSVREAISRLESDGFVEPIANGGTCVTLFTPERIRHTFRIRASLESLAVELCAQQKQPHWLDSLQRAADEMTAVAGVGDLQRFFDCDLVFHQRLWEYSGNPLLPRLLRRLVIPLFAFVIMKVDPSPVVTEDLVKRAAAHQQIADAIRQEDPAVAAEFMRRTTDGFCERILGLLEKQAAVPAGERVCEGSVP